ncbi:MAG: hypothetical protein ACYSOZ_04155 [Planctomycetota bacterium]
MQRFSLGDAYKHRYNRQFLVLGPLFWYNAEIDEFIVSTEYRTYAGLLMIRKMCLLICVAALSCGLQARPLNIIIVTSTDSSEDGYAEFLQNVYLDNANVEIDDDRYKESSLNDTEKQQLRDADLIIVSSDNSGYLCLPKQ